MKETHIFYAPDVNNGVFELPTEEAIHAVRVLRMHEGDTLTLTDGKGCFYDAHITFASPKHCLFNVDNQYGDTRLWQGTIHIAVAPTKNMERMEWLIEKATEIGVDRITLLDCDNSERHIVKTDRLDKIAISAMKQSHKAFKPTISGMMPLHKFIAETQSQQRFIAHCYDAQDVGIGKSIHLSGRNFLADLLTPSGESIVLIGPEGDFSLKEVEECLAANFRPVSLGESRLRTETAALVAVHLMYLVKRNCHIVQ